MKSLRSRLVLHPIPRREDASPRLVWLMLAARFLDEWGIGIFLVLLPTLQDVLGLSYAQIGVLLAVFGWADWIADPLAGLAADVWPRRPIFALGALGTGLIFFGYGAAGGFGPAGFVLLIVLCLGYSITATPPATISDALLVETHPAAPGRIMARQTLIDTVGALLAPLSVTLLAALSVDWPLAFLGAGGVWLAYALLIGRTPFPPNGHTVQAGVDDAQAAPAGPVGPLAGLRAMGANLRTVSRLPGVWRWLFIGALGDFLTDVLVGFLPLFLADALGLDEAALGLVLSANMLASLVALEPALARWGERRVLISVVIGAGGLLPLWLLAPSPTLAIGLLLAFSLCTSAIYPVTKARLLAASEGYTTTVTALAPLASVPVNLMPLVIGAIASAAGLRLGMLALAIAPPLMLILLRGTGQAEARSMLK
jgi:MFS family permease